MKLLILLVFFLFFFVHAFASISVPLAAFCHLVVVSFCATSDFELMMQTEMVVTFSFISYIHVSCHDSFISGELH